MQTTQTVGKLHSAELASPLGRIRISVSHGHVAALDFVNDTGQTDSSAHQSRASEGLAGGRRISTLRLASEGEPALPMAPDAQSAEAGAEDGCRLDDAGLTGMPAADIAVMRQVADELCAYFQGRLQVFSIPLLLQGTEFQRRIWEALCQVPYGTHLSYGELAARAGYAQAAYGRAAGAAVGRNPVSIIVPCHRVVAGNGRLTGYSGGLWRKLRLLDLEGFRLTT